MRQRAVLVDMDGTLVDVSSIRHHVTKALRADGSYATVDFDAFHSRSVDCPPIPVTVDHVHRWHLSGHAILIVTARSEKYRPHTSWWLADNYIPHVDLHMRDSWDSRPDYEVKKDILSTLRRKWDIVHAIDDNPSVITLWREEGIPVTVIPGWED